MGLPILFGGGGSSRYQIANSLRFRASNSAFLSRTPGSTTNRRTWTWSGWVKRGTLTDSNFQTIYSAGTVSSIVDIIAWNTDDTIRCWLGTNTYNFITNARYRDVSGWYHIVVAVDTTQGTAANRFRLYVNGSEVTSFSTAVYPPLDFDTGSNFTSNSLRLGFTPSGDYRYLDGHLANVTFVDGQALAPSSFGERNAISNEWVPKAYTGTYGTNGFLLEFKDAASTVTIGNSTTGSNNWTSSGISVTAGVTFDQMTDTPTNNFCTWSPLKQSGSGLAALSAANLRLSGASGESAIGTQGMASGKWYWEIVYSTLGVAPDVGIIQLPGNMTFPAGQKHYVYRSDGNKRSDGPGPVAYGASWTSGDVIGIAFDADAGSITFYKNNISQGVAFSGISSSEYPFFPCASVSASTADVNFGQRPFAYTPPTGFLALNTANLPTPAIRKSTDGFVTVLDTESNIDTTLAAARAAYPAWVEITKNRTSVETWAWRFSHDSANEYAVSSTATRQAKRTNSGADNWVGYAINIGNTYGTAAGSVSHTNGVATTVTHNLTRSRNAILLFSRAGGDVWLYHPALTAGSLLRLNVPNAETANTTITSVGSNSFQIGSGATTGTYDYLVLGEVNGFISLASHTGNASADGPFNWFGFKPLLTITHLLTTGAQNWLVTDGVSNPRNPVGEKTDADTADAATSALSPIFDFTAGGSKVRASNNAVNQSSGRYVNIAFAECPFKFATAR